MRRLLVAALVAAGTVAAAPAATACTLDTCWFSQPVCAQLGSCRICYYEPPGAQRCITR